MPVVISTKRVVFAGYSDVARKDDSFLSFLCLYKNWYN
ncbi:hypothetical protein SAMN05216167_107207 [Spirosoma endophyticum]|uniref:Uncharacterized protein n=1 Tax=Spirosoma endophyticum TaxID=662367 RepID=A0A1I1VIN5_9BACT|nr:hypothetical protein SAMN05216167_107207 [Spirosoma endophyticum]